MKTNVYSVCFRQADCSKTVANSNRIQLSKSYSVLRTITVVLISLPPPQAYFFIFFLAQRAIGGLEVGKKVRAGAGSKCGAREQGRWDHYIKKTGDDWGRGRDKITFKM